MSILKSLSSSPIIFIPQLSRLYRAIAILDRTLVQPQGIAVCTPRTIVRSLDILLVLANINILGAHLLGSLNSLGLLHWITE
ncbi:MAG: DUF3611 family protein [Cyanobacteria bacterium P01_A01_bin.17]